MILVKKITPPTVDLYAPDGTFLGTLNEYEFLDARVQIKENGEWGYYAIFNGKKIRIDRYGEIEECPIGMFDQIYDMLFKLLI